MYFVYILKADPIEKFYCGFTEKDVFERLKEHNQGESFHTTKYKPWKLIWYCGFESKKKALDFEKYLKSGSGHAFRNKHLV